MQKTKRKIKHLHFYVNQFSDYATYTDKDETKDIVFNNLIESVKYGVEEGRKDVELFLIDAGQSAIILSKDKWKSSLKTAIKFYSKKADYEKCIDCQELINLVN